LFVAPDVSSHHKELDRRLVQHVRVNTLEPVIEPAQLQAEKIALQVDVSGGSAKAEVEFADGIRYSAVRPGADEQLALARFRRAAVLAHAGKVADRVLQENIVPAANIERGNRHPLMLSAYRDRFHKFAVHRMLDIVKKGRSDIG